MRRFVLGDVHGNLPALKQVLDRSGFSDSDQIIFLGDVCDGWPDTKGCIDLLLTIRNRIILRGNHCDWMDDWANRHGIVAPHWFNQGGRSTLESYGIPYPSKRYINQHFAAQTHLIPDTHLEYLKRMRVYYILGNKLFVHGGCGYPFKHPAMQGVQNLIWDRDMWYAAIDGHDPECEFDEIFIGHTATNGSRYVDEHGGIHPPSSTPANYGKVWNVDQGAGWAGKLTLMDIDTKEYWQSDLATDLYPGRPPGR